MRHEVENQADAEAALEYFNGFHDGFVRELTLRSHDRFEARGVHETSGRLDLDIVFAHYNYRDGEPPADQLVLGHFFEVREVAVDFPMLPGDWAIMALRIEAAPGGRLIASMLQHRLVEGEWVASEGLRFSFTRARLLEQGP